MGLFDTNEGPPKTELVVPCYNEERRLLASEFTVAVAARPWLHLLFVNDGSTDDTRSVIQQMCEAFPEQISALDLERNSGKAEAVRRGILEASSSDAELLGYWDADLSTPLHELDAMVDRITRREGYLVMGVRLPLLGCAVSRALLRQLIARAFTLCARAALLLHVHDTQCGAKVIRNTSVTCEVFGEPFSARWIFDIELLARIRDFDRRNGTSLFTEGIHEHPLETWTEVPGSKLKAIDFVTAAADLLSVASSVHLSRFLPR